MRLSIFQQAMLLVALPLVFWIGFVIGLGGLLQQAESDSDREAHAKELLHCIDEIRKAHSDAGLLGTQYAYTHQPVIWKQYEEKCLVIEENLNRAKELAHGNPEQELLMTSMEAAFHESKEIIKSIQDSPNPLLDLITQQRRDPDHAFARLRNGADSLMLSEHAIADQTHEDRQKNREIIRAALIGGVCFNTALTVMLIGLFSRTITSRLRTVMDNTRRISRRENLHPQVKGNDEIAELDKVLHTTATELKQLEQFKKELTAVVSHELRTPLTSIQGVLALLSTDVWGPIPAAAQPRIKIAENNTVRLIRLINELLDIEKMEAGMLEMSIKPINLVPIVEESVEAVIDYASAYEVSIDSSCGEIWVTADGDRIGQVIINLLSNAIKYSPAGSMVSLEVAGDGKMAEVRVLDSGQGIPAEFQDKVFEKFQQVQTSEHKPKHGTGLGLAISKLIVEQHGGEIGFNSGGGHGTTFWFRIPECKKP